MYGPVDGGEGLEPTRFTIHSQTLNDTSGGLTCPRIVREDSVGSVAKKVKASFGPWLGEGAHRAVGDVSTESPEPSSARRPGTVVPIMDSTCYYV